MTNHSFWQIMPTFNSIIKGAFLALLLLPYYLQSQQDTSFYAIAFYNVENLFHPEDDPEKADDSFTPEGLNRWNYSRYYKKIHNIAKTILAMNDSIPPIMIGLAEVENDKTLKQLCFYSPLSNLEYDYIHYESPDNRGIDVALIYRKNEIEIIESRAIGIVFPFESSSKNRDVLYVVSRFPSGDTLHLFINHWTSRFGGYAATIPKRNHYAAVLRQKTDSLFEINKKSSIIIMGDFNDYPNDESLNTVLGAAHFNDQHKETKLINLMSSFSHFQNIGTHKYEDFWGCLDQIIVSTSLFSEEHSLQIVDRKAEIVVKEFLLEDDYKYGGVKPFRTYIGPKYRGGYSDHLPIMVKMKTIRKQR